MSRVDKMSSDAEEFSTKFLEFMRMVGENPELLVCIFEGEDEKYYSGRLQAVLNDVNWEGINTGGRIPAIELFETIKDHPLYSTYKYFCFIDRDYDDIYENHTPSKIYSTPGYSIENFYFSLACLKKILAAEFDIRPENGLKHLHERYTGLFQKAQADFIEAIRPLNVWAKTNYIMEKSGPPLKMSIKSVKTGDLVSVTIEGVESNYKADDISSVFAHLSNSDLCPESHQEATLKLAEQDSRLSFRGKNCADFMRLYLLAIKSEIQTLEFKEAERPKVRINFSKDNFLSEVSQYADTPSCLMRFLFQNCLTTATAQPLNA